MGHADADADVDADDDDADADADVGADADAEADTGADADADAFPRGGGPVSTPQAAVHATCKRSCRSRVSSTSIFFRYTCSSDS